MARTRRHERIATLTQADGRSWTFSTQCSSPEQDAYYTLFDIPGWFGGSGVKANITERSRHSAFEMRGYREGRTMSLVGGVIALTQEACDLAQRELSSMMWSGEMGTLRVEESERITLNSRVRLDGAPKIERLDLTHLEFTIPLYSPEAFLYADARTEYSYPVGVGLGLVYPWFSGYYDPPEQPEQHEWSVSSTFEDLSDLFHTGVIGAGGGAALATDTLWASDGLTSLRIGPGTTRSSAAYVVPQQTPLGEWAGRWMTAEADLHLESTLPDPDPTNSAPHTGITAGMNFVDGRDARFDYGSSGPGPTAPGTYRISTGWLMPEDLTVYSGWFMRLHNGSRAIPAWWDNLKLTGREVPLAEVSRSTQFYIDGWRVCQGWDIDQETGGYYVAQPKSYYEFPRRVNLASNPSFETGLTQVVGGVEQTSGLWSGNASGGVDSTWAAYGTQSVRIGPKSDTSTNDTTFYPFGNQSPDIAAGLGMTPGKTFTVGATIHLTKPQTGTLNEHARRIRINNRQEGLTDWGWAYSEAAPNVAGDYRVHVTFTVPSNSVGIHMNLCNGSATDTVWWDALTVEEGATDGSWFDAGAESIGPATDRVNLAQNPTFTTLRDQVHTELSDPIAFGGGASGALDTAWALDGSTSLRVNPGSSISGAAYAVGRADLTEEWAGRLVTIGATVHIEKTATDLAGNADNVPRSIMVGHLIPGQATDYQYAVSEAPPNQPGTYRLKVTTRLPESGGWFVRLFNGSQTQPVWWDAVTIEDGETDGSWFVAERGTNVARKNWAANPSMTTLKGQLGTGNMSGGSGASVAISTDWASSGTSSLKITPGTSSNSSAYLSSSTLAVAGGAEFAGKTVTASLDLRVPKVQTGTLNAFARSIGIGIIDATGAASVPSENWGAPAPNTVGTYRLSATATIPADAKAMYVYVRNGSANAADVLYVDNLLIEEGPNVRPYFDGSTAMARWTGATNASASELASTYSDQDAYIRRLDPDGNELDQMLLTGGGHVNEVAVEHDPDDPDHAWIWIQYDATPGFGVRMKYRPGIVYPGDTGIQGLGVTGKIVVDYSILRGEICVRTRNTDGSDGVEGTYEVFDLEDYKAGVRTVKRRLTDITKVPHAYQGFAFDATYLYVAHGGSKEDAVGIWRYAWDGSDKGDPEIIRTSIAEALPSGSTRHEMEGIAIREGATPADDTIVFGVNSGPLHERVMSVHDMTSDQFNYRDEWESGSEAGEVTTPDGILTYGEELTDPQATVSNSGRATSHLRASVVGNFPGGVTIDLGQGALAITYPWALTREAPLVLDGQGTAFIGETNVTHLLSRRDYEVLQVPPGGTRSIYLAGLQGGTGYLQVEINDTYI